MTGFREVVQRGRIRRQRLWLPGDFCFFEKLLDGVCQRWAVSVLLNDLDAVVLGFQFGPLTISGYQSPGDFLSDWVRICLGPSYHEI